MTASDGGLRLSFAQEQLWFLEQLRCGTTEYVMHWAFRVRGPLDLDALEAALTGVADRHEVLRTRYETVEGTPVQVVDEPGPVHLSVVDLMDLPSDEAGREVDRIGAADVRTPIDIRAHWPWRVTLVRLASDHAVLMIAAHHIAFDGWSCGILAEEVSALYGALVAGERPSLPPLPVQYADFADWQRAWWAANEGRLVERLDYWRGRLAGLEPLDLPTDRPRPPHFDAGGDSVTFTVPADLAGRLAEVGRANGCTEFMVHLAAFQLLLSRYSGQRDIAVGVSVSGRDQVEVEPLIGLFLHTVVMRADLSGAPAFVDLLSQGRDTVLGAFEHQDVPFGRVVADLAPDRDPARNPLFQVGFAMHNAPRVPLRLAGAQVERYPTSWSSSAFDLSLHMTHDQNGGLTGSLLYPTALFDRARIERMAGNHLRLLAEIADRPDSPVGELSVVAESEARSLATWSRTAPAGQGHSLLELFAERVARAPDAVAVLSGTDSVDYARLAARVDRLADHLRGLGVTTETPVGVTMSRGADLVVALLAVLTAGGTYVPLPPDLPAGRRAFMADDARVAVVLTEAGMRDRIPAGPRVVAVDAEWEAIARGAAADRPVVDRANAAYVMYTSGSTGEPKGVVVTHGGLRDRVLWSVRTYRLGPDDRVLQKTAAGFDASLWEFLAPLVSGGTVVMAPDDAHRDPTLMVRAVADHAVTVLQLVPSVLRLVVDEPGLAACSALRVVCCAGEPLTAALCDRLRDVVDVEVVNTYGPTECSIDVTAWRHVPGEGGAMVPIGSPLPGFRVYVVDARDQLVPIGVPGELCVSGVGVARGYRGRGGLTAERFTPNPYPDSPGERWYRTGDLVRWRADGVLEFVGRVDDQVKLHGVRVEPGEVEAALRGHPSVAAAVALPRSGRSGDLELVAYVVPSGDAAVRSEDLREHLAARLPATFVPSVIVGLDALPLTPNGKVDRSALPDPEARPESEPDPRVPLGTPTERTVAAIMAEVLGVDAVGADDDFFTLGGHSLLAIRLMLRLRRQFDVELAVADLFTGRTVAKLAAVIEAGTASTTPEIRPVPRDGDLPLSFGQRRLWFLDQLEPGSAEYLIPLAVRLRGPLDTDLLRRAFDEVGRRHEILRTRYADRGGNPVQVIDPPGPVAFDLVDVAGTPDAPERARDLVERASSRPFDLEREHPLRVTVARVAEGDHLVAITLHHIVFDAWSMGLFFRDLDRAYRGLAEGAAEPLDLPPIQYADFAAWQVEQVDATSDPDSVPHVDYWRERLAGLAPVELPTDHPRPAVRDPRGDTVRLAVPDGVARAIAEIADRCGATPFMTLLAAFQVLLGRYTGRTDLAVGTPVAGRTREETEEVLGFFVNNLVVRNDLSGDPRFVDLLDQVRRTALDAFANQDVPFERLVEVLRPDRDLSRNPLFQIMFELAQMEDVPDTLAGAALEPVNAGTEVAKFDLTLSVKRLADGGLRCWFEYSTALFERSTIERMAAQYARLLAAVAADPKTRICDLDIFSAAERRALLEQWPDPEAHTVRSLDPPDERHHGVPALFERRVARTPDAVAVVCGQQALTYAELNERANRLAHHLRSVGVGPETVVASCLERGPEAVVALVAVLKAGGVYVPFDPAHPARRLDTMLADSGARLVLTTRRLADRFTGPSAPPDRPVVAVDDGDGRSSATNPIPTAGPDNLAYIIYTSGSTGQPKGVMITHRSFAHHCRVIADAYGIGPGERVVLLSALTFDVAMDQIVATLLAGATVVVSDPLFWTPAELPARIAEHGVTIMEITPAYYREVMATDVTGLRGLKLMNVGSDVVTVSDARRWAVAGLPGRFLCNYGPTEATVTCLLHPIDGDLAGQRDETALPIGRAVAGTSAYVLDDALRPVPVGVPGELFLGGDRLARGYLNRPGLTADRFVPDPFDAGSRLYRTGDLVRHRADGTIEFLGRVDQQVKIRGFRVELGEIEAAVSTHPAVRAATVVAREIAPGDVRLVGYLVPRAGTPPEPTELRAHLRDLLPEYMIPSLWVPMDALPMTTSQKVDRAALPAPAGVAGGRVYRPPAGPAETAIAEVWADVLGVDRIGRDDNFFDLGGHSLLATRVLARLRQDFAVDLPLRALFDTTTVADLAAALTAAVEADIAHLSDADVENALAKEGAR